MGCEEDMMDGLRSEGETLMHIEALNGVVCRISILSRRGAWKALTKSRVGEWAKPIVAYEKPFGWGEWIAVGFQPATGTHIVIREWEGVTWR